MGCLDSQNYDYLQVGTNGIILYIKLSFQVTVLLNLSNRAPKYLTYHSSIADFR